MVVKTRHPFSMTPEKTISCIRQKQNIAVLLLQPDDELSVRAQQAFHSYESRILSRGFQVVTLEICPKTTLSEELACVRAPQLRFFAKGKLHHKVVGVLDEAEVDAALRSLI